MDYLVILLAVSTVLMSLNLYLYFRQLKKLEKKVDKLDMETDQIAGIIFDNHVQINELKAKKEDVH